MNQEEQDDLRRETHIDEHMEMKADLIRKYSQKKTCEYCKCQFQPARFHPHQKYCSSSCNSKRFSYKTGKICRECNRPLTYRNKSGLCKSHVRLEERSPLWKEDKSYGRLHIWIRRHKPKPAFCERCNARPPQDVANISGTYKKDINDFEWLCRRCHIKTDGRLEKFKKLNIDDVRDIRRRAATGTPRKDLAREFRVSPYHITGIIKKRTWKEIK